MKKGEVDWLVSVPPKHAQVDRQLKSGEKLHDQDGEKINQSWKDGGV
jgi:hypothetical protein